MTHITPVHIFIPPYNKGQEKKGNEKRGRDTNKKGGAMKDIEVFGGRNLTVNKSLS